MKMILKMMIGDQFPFPSWNFEEANVSEVEMLASEAQLWSSKRWILLSVCLDAMTGRKCPGIRISGAVQRR